MDPKANKDLGAPLRFNPYLYCVNNPLTRIDPDGKSDVYFSRQQKVLVVVSSEGAVVGTFPAANNVDWSSSETKGQFPLGEYKYSHRGKLDKDQIDKNGSYGTIRPFVFAVPEHENLAFHAGKENKGFEWWTYGCIRTTEKAMSFIDIFVQNDPLKTITVVNDKFSDDLEMKLRGYNLLRDLSNVSSRSGSNISTELIGGNTNVQMGVSVEF